MNEADEANQTTANPPQFLIILEIIQGNLH